MNPSASSSISQTEILYRTMVPADIPAARDLWSGAAGVELSLGDEPSEIEAYLLRNPGMSFVAMKAGRMVAAVMGGHDGRRGYLYHLAVHPDFRGAGIGREVAARSRAAIEAAGIRRCIILVAPDNESGALFWERAGWEAFEVTVMAFDA